MKKILKNISLLLLLIGIIACNTTHQLKQLEKHSIPPKENILSYLAIKDNFKSGIQKTLFTLKKSPKVRQLLPDKNHQLLIKSFPTLENPFASLLIRRPWNDMNRTVVTFQVNAYTGEIRVKTPPFSEAYYQGIFSQSLQAWEQE